MIDEARIDKLRNAAQKVGEEYNQQQRARLMVALEYGRLLQQLRDVARHHLGQKWADRILNLVAHRAPRPNS